MSTQQVIRHFGRLNITGTLRTLTGLHIGGTEVGLQIGGADNSIVRNGLDGRPYIPGSSLKGKLRCLLARVYTPGKLEEQRGTFPRLYRIASAADYDDPAKGFLFQIFGITPEEARKQQTEALPTRLLVRDARMSDATAKALEASLYTDMPFTQVKTEVVIDRITSAATPRQMERVPAGADFEFNLVFNCYLDTDPGMLKYVQEAMDLLEHDALGGQGSRGYGQVRFVERSVEITSFGDADLNAISEIQAFCAAMVRNETKAQAS